MKINEVVRQMHPPRYTVSQAAGMVGKDIDTLRRWKRSGVYSPSEYRQFGALRVGLYTDDDIRAMKQIAKERKPGPKPHHTTKEKDGNGDTNGQEAALTTAGPR